MLAASELWLIISVATLTGIIAALVLDNRRGTLSTEVAPVDEPLSLLFEKGLLHHATDRALSAYGLSPGTHIWDDLRSALISRFPQFPESICTTESGSMIMVPPNASDPSRCEINWRDDKCWVDITDADTSDTLQPRNDAEGVPNLIYNAMQHPVWEVTVDGQVGWCNRAFELLLSNCAEKEPEKLFPLASCEDLHRVPVQRQNGQTDWFDVSFFKDGKRTIYSANCVTPLVQAENVQNTFVQTLAKTFAHLSIGLAIFDKENRLSIFNPALVDLTQLQPTFLAGKPTMRSFFDELRERRGMPEPKNYSTWRQDISNLIAAASGAKYRDTWCLEDGRTFSVQGRPHPGGATAFMIEDISSEITLTRNFRVEVEQYEALLDNVEDAIAVFSAAGVLTFCNDGYRALWGQNPEAAFADVTIHDAVDVWKERTHGTVPWEVFVQFISALGQKQPKTVDLALSNGALIMASLTPIASDATMVRFSLTKANQRPAQPLLKAAAT